MKSRKSIAAFTLVELLVSMAVASLLLISLARILADTQVAWTDTKERTDSFREARAAFDAIAARLSQATLNSYWGYKFDDDGNPEHYERQSELHFVSGPVTTLLNESVLAAGHALFFQAPVGESIDTGRTTPAALSPVELSGTMNGWGWYACFDSDLPRRPGFLAAPAVPERKRFRLMEFRQPTEKLSLYRMVTPGNADATPIPWIEDQASQMGLYDWFRAALAEDSQPLAENILALVIQPLWPAAKGTTDKDTDVAPNYIYDSRRHQWPDTSELAARSRHQIPPMIRLTLVALDERDWDAMEATQVAAQAMELQAFMNTGLFVDAELYEDDIRELEQELAGRKLGYRIFTTAVQLPAAKLMTSIEN
ncbi:Verru_Chthon cassette protein C [Phragmitibacter flavus]|uniref:Verru_Chthon cassette protein C n=1 Tax=Phragmitibacter flavus TaxID=2576071 RepID=A0A5R8KFT3_9BACT|nr:Verru_Chthon cassette protein C [Phragmitibacter flavus]TLD70449.1 Verru_Chthon cassette protein C [Phragmitibacter flavus]